MTLNCHSVQISTCFIARSYVGKYQTYATHSRLFFSLNNYEEKVYRQVGPNGISTQHPPLLTKAIVPWTGVFLVTIVTTACVIYLLTKFEEWRPTGNRNQLTESVRY
jgi:hypothetical protein